MMRVGHDHKYPWTTRNGSATDSPTVNTVAPAVNTYVQMKTITLTAAAREVLRSIRVSFDVGVDITSLGNSGNIFVDGAVQVINHDSVLFGTGTETYTSLFQGCTLNRPRTYAVDHVRLGKPAQSLEVRFFARWRGDGVVSNLCMSSASVTHDKATRVPRGGVRP